MKTFRALLIIFCIPSYIFCQDISTVPLEALDSIGALMLQNNEFEKALIYTEEQRVRATKSKLDSSLCIAILRLGAIQSELSVFDEAEKKLKEAKVLILDKFGGNSALYVEYLNRLSTVKRRTRQYQETETLLLEAMEIEKKSAQGNPHFQPNITMFNLAGLYSMTNRFEQALPILFKAAEMEKNVGDSTAYIQTLMEIGGTYNKLGQYAEAEFYYREVISLSEVLYGKDNFDYMGGLRNLAMSLVKNKRLEDAKPMFIEIQNFLIEKLGKEHPYYSAVTTNLANLYKLLDEPDKAEQLFLEVKAIEEKAGLQNSPDYALTINNLAGFYQHIKQDEKAIPLFLEALSIWEKTEGKQHRFYANFLNNLAKSHYSLKNYETSFKYLGEARDLYMALAGKEGPLYANNMNNFAFHYYAMNEIDSTLVYSLKALAANSPSIDSELADISTFDQFLYYDNGTLLKSIDLLLVATQKQFISDKNNPIFIAKHKQLISSSIKINMDIKNSFSSNADKFRLLVQNNKAIDAALWLSVTAPQSMGVEEAFAYAEYNKSVLLADALKTQRAKVLGDIPDSMALHETTLQQNADKLKKQELEAKTDEEKASVNKELSSLNLQIDAFKKQLKSNFPKYYKLKYAHVNATAEEVQKQLGGNTAFLEYFISDTITYLFFLTKKDFQLIPFQIEKMELSQHISNLRKALSDYDFIKNNEEEAYQLYSKTAYWFYQQLVFPALKNAKDIETLIIVTDGELGHLPFEAFLTEKVQDIKEYTQLPYLLHKYKVSYNYSATLWAENLAATAKANNGRMLAAAASYKGKKDSSAVRANRAPHLRNLRDALQSLPAAKEEVEAISKLFVGDFFYGDEANEQNFKAKASEYGILHLAMHGILNERSPILSSLAFTENGDSTEDNFLEAWEISHLKLNADLVVLSACETGYGKFQQGEGIMSLARSFMYAGVPSLVVSMWQVNDASTSLIMQSFYKNLAKGMDKAAALQQAKLEYIGGVDGDAIAAHPAFWAPFVQLGDSRPIKISKKSDGYWFWGLLGGGIMLVIGVGVIALRRRRKEH